MLFLHNYQNDNAYQSLPGIGAGSSAQPFRAAVAFMNFSQSSQPCGLLSNTDGTRGWRLFMNNEGDGSITFNLHLRRDNNTTFMRSFQTRPSTGVAFLAVVDVGPGEDAPVRLWVNGVPVIDERLGDSRTFLPAANARLELGDFTQTGLTGQTIFAGAAFAEGVEQLSWPAPVESNSLFVKEVEGMSPAVGLWNAVLEAFALSENWTYAWDVKSLLESDLGAVPGFINGAAGEVWAPSPNSGSEVLERVAGGEAFPAYFMALNKVDWAPVTAFPGDQGGQPLTTALDLYVAPLTGDDGNSGTSPMDPVETLEGAYSKIPTNVLAAPVTIHMAQGENVTWTPIPDFIGTTPDGQIIIWGDGAGQGTEDGFLEILTGVAGATTSADFVDFPAIADQFLGFTIEFTDGAAAGQRRTVRNNTALGIVPAAAFSPAPASGDSFRIVAPSTIFDTQSETPICAASNSLYPTLINVAWVSPGRVSVDNVPCLKMYGCIFSAAAGFQAANSNVYSGVSSVLQLEEDIHFEALQSALSGAMATPVSWLGWGVGNPDTPFTPGDAPLDKFTGYVSARGDASVGFDGCDILLFGGTFSELNAQNGKVEFRDGSAPFLLRGVVSAPLLLNNSSSIVEGGDAVLSLDTSSGNGAIVTTQSSSCLWKGPLTLDIEGGALGILSTDMSDFTVEYVSGEDVVFNIDGNSAGIVVDNSSSFNALDGSIFPGVPGNFFVNFGDGGGAFAGAISFSSTVIIEADEFQMATSVANNYGAFPAIVTGSSLHVKTLGESFISEPVLAVGSFEEGLFRLERIRILSASTGVVLEASSRGTLLSAPPIFGSGLLSCINECVVVDASSQLVLDNAWTLTSDTSDVATVQGNSSLVIADASVLTATLGTAIVANLGAKVSLQGAAHTIGAAVDGVNLTGGGELTVENAPIVGAPAPASELVVAPAVTSTFAAAFPAPGSSFSNPGSGSVATNLN